MDQCWKRLGLSEGEVDFVESRAAAVVGVPGLQREPSLRPTMEIEKYKKFKLKLKIIGWLSNLETRTISGYRILLGHVHGTWCVFHPK
jgi:hypothetical protein